MKCDVCQSEIIETTLFSHVEKECECTRIRKRVIELNPEANLPDWFMKAFYEALRKTEKELLEKLDNATVDVSVKL